MRDPVHNADRADSASRDGPKPEAGAKSSYNRHGNRLCSVGRDVVEAAVGRLSPKRVGQFRKRFVGDSPWQRVWRNLRRSKKALIGFSVLVVLTLLTIFAPQLTPQDPYALNISDRFAPPSGRYLLGTDHFGRDTLSRLIYGAAMVFQVASVSVLLALVVGVPVGAMSAYFGGRTDQIIMRIADALLAFPSLVLALLLRASLGPTVFSVMIAISVGRIPIFARTVRSSVLKERERDYVEAARCIGQTDLRILFTHILPNVMAPVVVLATVFFANAILVEAGMSYLGIGTPPPAVSWGQMLNEARPYLQHQPQLVLFPGIAISLVVLGVNLLGDALRDALDPRLMYD